MSKNGLVNAEKELNDPFARYLQTIILEGSFPPDRLYETYETYSIDVDKVLKRSAEVSTRFDSIVYRARGGVPLGLFAETLDEWNWNRSQVQLTLDNIRPSDLMLLTSAKNFLKRLKRVSIIVEFSGSWWSDISEDFKEALAAALDLEEISIHMKDAGVCVSQDTILEMMGSTQSTKLRAVRITGSGWTDILKSKAEEQLKKRSSSLEVEIS
jgi:hypothetical protein